MLELLVQAALRKIHGIGDPCHRFEADEIASLGRIDHGRPVAGTEAHIDPLRCPGQRHGGQPGAVARQIAEDVIEIVLGLLPGILAGTLVVSRVNPPWLKLGTLAALLPLTLLQAGGIRRPIRAERPAGFLFGGGVGALYAVTTISGPPLALALNNQGFSKDAFRAALGLVRLAASLLTGVAYLFAGLFVRDSVALLPWMLPSVAIGVPAGAIVIRRLHPETFRRICMSFDAGVVSFGVSTLLRELHLVDSGAAYLVMVVTVLIDGFLLARFFSGPKPVVVTHAA